MGWVWRVERDTSIKSAFQMLFGRIIMTTPCSTWYSFSAADSTLVHCASCGNAFDLQWPALDHHTRSCPICKVECVFLDWKNRLVQIVFRNAPPVLTRTIRWMQENLDELEYVELLCALEELMDASLSRTS